MKNYLNMNCLKLAVGAIFLSCGLSWMSSCTEKIDDSNYAIKKEQSISEYIASSKELSDIKQILDRVKLGRSQNASSLTAVLSARGHYTIFAPTNEAVEAYLKQLGKQNIADLTYEQAQLIANNCIIDNEMNNAYETPDFPVKGTFNYSNLNDRMLTCLQDTAGGSLSFIINGTSKVVKENIRLNNGVLHEVSTVISPSAKNVAEMIAAAPNMKVMARLLEETGWADSLTANVDLKYEDIEHPETKYFSSVGYTKFPIPQKRYLGYTGFVETDDVYKRDWGINVNIDAKGHISNWDQVKNVIQAKAESVYGSKDENNLKSPDNAINRFVAYHFLKGKIAYDKFVHHFNEYGYKYGADPHNPQTINYTVDIWDYFVTAGKYPSLIKVTQVPTGEHEIYINRVAKYNNGFNGNYQEISSIPYTPGSGLNIKIYAENGTADNNALNGYYYPIDGILLDSKQAQDALSGERMRFDLCTILPEIMSNSFRGNGFRYFPNNYFDEITNVSSNTEIYYLHAQWNGAPGGWKDYEGDEFLFSGLFDFVLRLPPVPKDGTYEIRMGVSQNPLRGMSQLYFGDDPYNLKPTGLPIDLRQSAVDNPFIPWVKDVDDEQTNIENDRNMRNQGYMKAPKYMMVCDGNGTTSCRSEGGASPCLRKILTVQNMKAGKYYYIRFKSALKKLDSQFFVDYFEYVPTSVYNGAQSEDIW